MDLVAPLAAWADRTPVTHLMESKVQFVSPSMPASEALRYLMDHGFDAAPLMAERAVQYVAMDDLKGQSGRVIDHARAIDAHVLASSTLNISDAVCLLGDTPYFFVLEGMELAGIVTRAELQKAPVSLLLLGFILGMERASNAVIEAHYGADAWVHVLSSHQQQKVETTFMQRQRNNVAISRLECLMLHQRLTLVGKQQSLREALGYGSTHEWNIWTSKLKEARDGLAHGRDLLGVQPDPLEAIDLFVGVRDFADRMSALAQAFYLPQSA